MRAASPRPHSQGTCTKLSNRQSRSNPTPTSAVINPSNPRPATANPETTSAHRHRHQHRQNLASPRGHHNAARHGWSQHDGQPVVIVIPSPPPPQALLMHNDLAPLLNDSVYRALDAYANAPIKENQISLPLAEGDIFDAPKRGNAPAIAGHSAAQPGTKESGFGHGINTLSALHSDPPSVCPSELGGPAPPPPLQCLLAALRQYIPAHYCLPPPPGFPPHPVGWHYPPPLPHRPPPTGAALRGRANLAAHYRNNPSYRSHRRQHPRRLLTIGRRRG